VQYLTYIIPAAVVAIIFFYGFMRARAKMAQAHNPGAVSPPARRKTPPAPVGPRVYEALGVNQHSSHPLGAVQSVIRGQIRSAAFGLVLIGAALCGLYAVYRGNFGADIMESFGGRTPLNVLIVTALMAGAILWGLQLISYASYRIKLRRTGFEMSSIFGTKAYEYKEVDFHLAAAVEHKYDSEGYRPVIMKSQNYNWIWVCQVVFHDGRKPLIWKSSRYAWLKSKVRELSAALEGKADV
jgi:hypothetical protein